jgi:hypothetical protein
MRQCLPVTQSPQRTGKLVLSDYPSRYSEWKSDKSWSSQEWKFDELLQQRTVKLVFAQHTDEFIVEDDEMYSDAFAESQMTVRSRSFLHRGE